MKIFQLIRHFDKKGISGDGTVAEGVVFTNGKVILQWRGRNASISIWENLDQMLRVHGHNGQTEINWMVETAEQPRAELEAEHRRKKRAYARSEGWRAALKEIVSENIYWGACCRYCGSMKECEHRDSCPYGIAHAAITKKVSRAEVAEMEISGRLDELEAEAEQLPLERS